MRKLLTAMIIPAACVSLVAQSTGRMQGKVTGKDGKPVPGVVFTISRKEITWTKTLQVDAKGNYMQVGLEPKEFDIEITAPGYQGLKETIKIPLGDTFKKDYVLMTTKEAQEQALAQSQANMSESEKKSISGSHAFNTGVEFYNRQEFAEARPHLVQAVEDLRAARKALKEGEDPKPMDNQLAVAERVCGLTLFEVGRKAPVNPEYLKQAMPMLEKAFQANPKDQRLALALAESAKGSGDEAAATKYQAILDALVGPRPELAYNDGVTAFNNGDFETAKKKVDNAIRIDPAFADSYWLKGVVEFSLNNLKAAKEAFKTYLEKAPNGKKAGEVKEFLKELK